VSDVWVRPIFTPVGPEGNGAIDVPAEGID
jgi:hypothetical protein